MRPLRLAILGLCVSLPACHLVNQRDFNAQAGMPPELPKKPVVVTPEAPALVTIRFADANPPYQPELTAAVRKALALKADARFTVRTEFPRKASADASADAAAHAADIGRGVAQTIVAAGAAPAQVEQEVAAADGGVVTVRVLVR